MEMEYINCFITSTCKVFETMLNMPVEVGTPGMKEQGKPAHDVSAIIGMSGDMEGTVVLSFPVASAQRVVSLLTGASLEPKDPDFADGIGELVNMIAGGAKALFKGRKASMTCPSVVIGLRSPCVRQEGCRMHGDPLHVRLRRICRADRPASRGRGRSRRRSLNACCAVERRNH